MARYLRVAAALCIAVTIQGAAAPAATATGDAPVFDPSQPIEGIWETPEKSQITIIACPDDFCGSLTKIVVPPEELAKLPQAQRDLVAKMDPSQFPDARNEDATLRTRSLLGLQILTINQGDGTNFKGKLYNPQDGKLYDGYVKVIDANNIEVGGCVMGYCGQPIPHQEWTRAIADETQTTGAAAPAPAKPGKKGAAANAADPGGF